MLSHNILQVFHLFENNGFEIRIVGGAVRDFLLNKKPKDFDFCTTATPSQMIEIAKKNNINVIPTGILHGTVTFHIGNDFFEITTLRVDKKCDGRHAVIEFTSSFEEDARRRDLTINAMMMDKHGTIFDWFGGQDDINSEVIRFVGDSEERIKEDFLRILRFFRFASKFEKNTVTFDRKGKEAICNNINGLRNISSERIWAELSKILTSNSFPIILNELENCGIFNVLEISIIRKDLAIKVQQKNGTAAQILSALVATSDNDVEHFSKKLKLSNIENIEALWFFRNIIKPQTIDDAKVFLVNGISFQWVKTLFDVIDDKDTIDFILNWEIPKFPVSGNDLIEKRIKLGPAMGVILCNLRTKWISSNFSLSKEELLTDI